MQSDDEQRAENHHAHGEIVLRADGLGLRAAAPGRMVLNPAVSAFAMVGRVLMSVMTPAAATAPAPMGLM